MANSQKPQRPPDKSELHISSQALHYHTYTARKSPEEQDTSRSQRTDT